MCTLQKKKQCTKKSVRQIWIENMVLEYAIRLAQDDALLDYIAENTYQYCLAQHTDTSYTKSLQNALAKTEKAIANLLRAIEAGIFNKSTKDRMNELEEQKAESKTALVAAKLKEDLGLKKENIEFFLHQFADLDYSDVACQKRLIKTFVNSVFVYDDKVVVTDDISADPRPFILVFRHTDASCISGMADAFTQSKIDLRFAVCHHPQIVVRLGEKVVSGIRFIQMEQRENAMHIDQILTGIGQRRIMVTDMPQLQCVKQRFFIIQYALACNSGRSVHAQNITHWLFGNLVWKQLDGNIIHGIVAPFLICKIAHLKIMSILLVSKKFRKNTGGVSPPVHTLYAKEPDCIVIENIFHIFPAQIQHL